MRSHKTSSHQLRVLWWCTIVCHAMATAALVLEHDLGDGTWTKAGTVDTVRAHWIQYSRTPSCTMDRMPMPGCWNGRRSALHKLHASTSSSPAMGAIWYQATRQHVFDRLYRLRIQSSTLPIATATRASCLAGQHTLTLYVADDGTPQALNYHPAGPCHKTAAPVQLPSTTPVRAGRATVIPDPTLLPRTPPKGVAPPKPAGPKGEPGAPAPPPEEKTWLQKNWIYLIPLFFVGTPSTCCL